MLINKCLIDAGYIIVRSIEPKQLKYFMDLRCIPIVRLNSMSINKECSSYGLCT